VSAVRVVVGDITRVRVDAIVNAANERMLGGGGVDGAIHAAAGPELLCACRDIAEIRPGVRCPTGEARITPAFALPAKWVIHTVGPIWRGGAGGEPELLASCYRASLALADAHAAQSIAFPAISCGVYGYPVALAAAIAVGSLRAALAQATSVRSVQLVAFNRELGELLSAALAS
jgi:O-acetyl-ADP-ribose deacetylase